MGSLALFIPLVVSLLLAPAHTFEGKPKFGPNAVPILERTAYLRAAPAPDFWKLSPFYVSQQTSSGCSVASITMAINFLRGLPGGAEEPIITQTLVLNKVGDGGWASDVAEGRSGVTFAEFVSVMNESLAAFRLHGYLVDVVRPDDPGMLQQLRQALAANEASDQDVVLVYFDQGVLTGDWDGPHISPIAAYDQENGQVLIMDVDREWYTSRTGSLTRSSSRRCVVPRRPSMVGSKARLAVLSGSSLSPRGKWSPIP